MDNTGQTQNATARGDISQLHQKLLAIKEDVGAIGKDRRGQGINYSFRGIDDIYNAIHTAQLRHKVMIYTQVQPGTYQRDVRELAGKEGRTRLQTQVSYIMQVQFIDAETGLGCAVTVPAEGYDDSDKAAGKSVSYGMKTGIAHALGIPTAVEEPDAERPSTEQDTAAAIDNLVKRLATASSLEEAGSIYVAAPDYAKRHPDVTAQVRATRERLS